MQLRWVIFSKNEKFAAYDKLPLFLNAATVAKVLGVSSSSAYELMHEPDSPVRKIGNRLIVPKEKFVETNCRCS